MNEADRQYDRFRHYATVVLGALAGLLIALPAGASMSGTFAMLSPPLFLALGALAGYRNRDNRGFFYLSLFTICAMLFLLLRA